MKTIAKILLIIALASPALAESNFSGSRLQDAADSYIRRTMQKSDNSLTVNEDIEIIMSKKIGDFKFDQDDVTAKFTANPKSLRGNSYIGLEFYQNDILLKRTEYPVRIKIYADCPTAVENIARGDVIAAEDVILERKEITIYKNNEIPSPDEIIGMRAAQNLSRGAIVLRSNLQNESAVNRGDIVNIVSASGAVKVSMKGVALQSAGEGEKIRVKKLNDTAGGKKVLEGFVYGGEVMISN
ncbi:MAG: flagellar basal body P-ring formation chaperone FlgA [Candidatus Kapabacteria bacterium]|nr:flagellar basal body P-ring formation chaperone FlgA [Candidatus Kapabacteria bacterium]